MWLAKVEAIASSPRNGGSIEFSLVEPIEQQAPALKIELLISVIKFDRFEWCLEKATELGVSRDCSDGRGAKREEIDLGGAETIGAVGEDLARIGAAVAAIEAARPCRF